METLYFLKFWKPNPSSIVETDNEFEVEDEEEEEEEDSFFDLKISTEEPNTKTHKEISNFYSKETKTELTIGVSSTSDPISKMRVLPIEPISKAQSHIALLKSAPRFGASIFRKPKSNSAKKTEHGTLFSTKTEQSTLFSQTEQNKWPEVKGNEDSSLAKLISEDSLKKTGRYLQKQNSDESKTERFSKDVMNKYMKLIKPLYLKSSKKNVDNVNVSGDFPMSSPAVSTCSLRKEKQGNTSGGIRVVCRQLGKSKSATSVAAASPVNRRDESLLVQADGIQSAILHCKRSFNSRDSSMLSRLAIESHERSARSSIEEELACF